MTVAQMRKIRTSDGATISVEADTDERTLAILKTAPVVSFQEFVYTGNHPNGQNSGNYEDLERWFLESGLKIVKGEPYEEDDLDILIYNLERVTGISALRHRGKTIRYHVQAHRGEGHGEFGYTWRADYRLIEVV